MKIAAENCSKYFTRKILAVILLAGQYAMPSSAAVVPLADRPLATSASVPGNLLLALSVEFPTAISSSYKNASSPYTPNREYIGYFDANKCYKYLYDTTTPANSYFKPIILATSRACTSTAALPLWSGNWLNWTSMQAIDTFRSALTGGYRAVDSATMTVLEKAWGSSQGSESGNAPNKTVPSSGQPASDVPGATPFTFSSATTEIWSLGNKMRIYGPSAGSTVVDYKGQNSYLLAPTTCTSHGHGCTSTPGDPLYANDTDVYDVYVRVQVCASAALTEANCVLYGSNYKPEGLLQQYSNKIRYGAFGYLNDPSIDRDGGVLRAQMKFIGPTKPVPGQPPISNGLASEWSTTDGTFIVKPDPSDASVSNSGVMNYLNKFGETSHVYKTYDPISELYYSAVRYLKHQGNVSAYSALNGSATENATWADGFPVVTNWDDPIQYYCQKSFILGIGDSNTHRDANLPGSTIRTNEPALPPEVSADTSVDVTNATNMIGTIEGVANLGTSNPPWCCNQNTYFVGGLAYDIHTTDMRPGQLLDHNVDSLGHKKVIQTASTYWLDVWESGYAQKNQYYYAAKYGGFSIPQGFLPYDSLNAANTLSLGGSTTPLLDSMWHTNTDVYGTDNRPDNYYSASSADKMVIGLKSAFADIAAQVQESSTAFSSSSAHVNSIGNASYQSQYESTHWSGDVIGTTVAFDTSGNPTYATQWHANTSLNAQPSRQILTCCTAGGSGLAFTDPNLTTLPLIARTNYNTFALVPGVAPASQSKPNYLAYLRGDRTRELNKAGGVYRTRTNLLGDIVNSKVTPVAAVEPTLTESTNLGFSAYRAANAGRKAVVYVGANDGMLHAFDGSIPPTTGGGTELFAYIPSFTYGDVTTGPAIGLASLGSTSFVHHYLVDQTPEAFDIDFAKTQGSTASAPDWRTVLIGGLGKGGKGYYALDVSSPSGWGTTLEANPSKVVLWEFTDPSLGYSYGDANVFKTKKYGWVVVFTSGYNNVDGVGYFFIVNPATGALLEKIPTSIGGVTAQSSGLTYASGFAPDISDGTADSIYAGDLNGNVWRVDLTAVTGSYPPAQRIASLTAPDGSSQPVTTRPLIEVQPDSLKRYVLIGTGRLLDNTDISSGQVQSFYAISDGNINAFYSNNPGGTLPAGYSFPIVRANMNANTDLTAGIGSAPTNPLGWYVDLSVDSNGVAERVNINPAVNYGVVAFAANLPNPNGDPCNASGTNRIFALNFGTGQSVLTNASNVAIPFSTQLTGVVTDLAFENLNGKIKLLAGNSQLQLTNIGTNGSGGSIVKKINWRELPTTN